MSYENFETITYSGDGQVVKIATLHDPVEGDSESDTNYQIRSTVFGGQTITKVQSGGQKLESNIVAAGTVVATHGFDWINWRHNDPNSDSIRSTNASGQTHGAGDDDFNDHELDGQGRSVGFTNPYSNDPQWDNIPDLYQAQQSYSSMINGMPTTFKVDGMSVPKQYFDDHSEFLVGNMFAMVQYSAWVSTQIAGYQKIKPKASKPKLLRKGQSTPLPKGADAYADFDVTSEGGQVESVRQYYRAVYASSSFSARKLLIGTATEVGLGAGTTPAGSSTNGSKGPSAECLKQVGYLGILDKALEIMKSPPIMDIRSIPSQVDPMQVMATDPAALWFSTLANSGETVSAFMRRKQEEMQSDVVTVRGGKSVPGIYVDGPISITGNFLLHEAVHLVYTQNPDKDFDRALVLDLNIKREAGMTDSQLVSRFFNSGCLSKYGGIK